MPTAHGAASGMAVSRSARRGTRGGWSDERVETGRAGADAMARGSPGRSSRPSTGNSTSTSVPAEVGAGAAHEEHRADRRRSSAGRGRPTRSVRPACARRATRILSGEQSIESLVNEHVGEIKAHIVERDGKVVDREDLPDARHLHRHAGDQPGVPRAAREPVPRPRLRRGHRHACTTTAPRRSSTAAARC